MNTKGDLIDRIVNSIDWPANWPKDAKLDFEVWVKQSFQQNPGYKHKMKLSELLDKIIKAKQKGE